MSYSPGTLVNARNRDWIVQPSEDPDLLLLKPLGGSEEESTGIYLPLKLPGDDVHPAEFPNPQPEDLGDFSTANLLLDSARLSFRNGAGPFRCFPKLSFRPRSYQVVPLIMALRQEVTRLLVADDVGVGKTIEALLIIKELLERRVIKRFAVLCLPHLCDQWQGEIRDKLGMEAVIIRTSTQAQLDRQIQGDASVYEYFPFQIISIDFIKSDARRATFLAQCPELVVVDEAHTCTRPAGASKSQQLRHALVSKISEKKGQHLLLLTATPHSGKPEEFNSLLGLLKSEFEDIDVPTASQAERKELASHFVQRQRGDIKKWVTDNIFPERDSNEVNYELSPRYAAFFNSLLEFTQKLVKTNESAQHQQHMRYWTALGLLRGCMSSPGAGVQMLANRMEKLGVDDAYEEITENPVHDIEHGFETDSTPDQVLTGGEWSDSQKRKFRELATELHQLSNPKDDQKLAALAKVVSEWLQDGFQPVVFCRFIPTAHYVGEQLLPLLQKDFPKIDLQVVTSEDPDEVRKERVEGMNAKPRVLVCTDCLSEGINLHRLFTAVIHYDLPWNPNRLEQREGRVDRFGQASDEVKATLLFSKDNPIEGIVLDVILRKVREIRRATGINVPFPEDSKSVIDAIAQSLLVNPDRKISIKEDPRQMEFDYSEFSEASEINLDVTDKLKKAADREKARRTIFAQHAIKIGDIEEDLQEMDQAIGNPEAVRNFVYSTLHILVGAQVDDMPQGIRIHTANLFESLKSCLPDQPTVLVSFDSPTPEGHLYLGRNHPFVEQLCQTVLAHSIDRSGGKRAARASVIFTKEVTTRVTLLLFRCRNVIERRDATHQIVAEEMLLWGYRGMSTDGDFIDAEEARQLLDVARPSANMDLAQQQNLVSSAVAGLGNLRDEFNKVAESRSKKLVEAHERFSQFLDRRRFQVVYPVLPMDVLGIYVLFPDRT